MDGLLSFNGKEHNMKNKLATLFAVATIATATIPYQASAGAGDVVAGLIGGAVIGAALTAPSQPVHYVTYPSTVVVNPGVRCVPPPRHFHRPPPRDHHPKHFHRPPPRKHHVRQYGHHGKGRDRRRR